MASSLTADSFFNLSTQHQSNNYNNKELIFVKLTDSALRTIEEFVKNQNKYGSINPSIQFLGNEGFLSFPIGNNGSSQQMEQRFKFSLTDNEETQGSYECLQQTNSGQINVLGPIQYKMRVHAQEDVYESTKRNMAKAAQQQKEKSTREIKPNQTDIGRKVTKKIQPASNNVRTMSSVSQSNGSSSNSSSLASKRPLDVDRNSSNDGNNVQSSHLSSSQQQIPTNNSHSYSNLQNHHDSLSYHHHHHHNNAINGVVGDDILQRSSTNMGHNSNRNSEQQNRRNPDIMRKPIKERLIHLLALRPFKKPELYDRLDREGIKERDRSVITNVLKTISHVRDNAYVLHRHVWNDVHEDWPFYTEQDRATLKRRKPQNLTPPLSSDGGSSSTSGQSPNSQHNGSPPPLIKRPSSQTTSSLNNMNLNDDNKYFEPVTKKTRISHYKKPHDSIDSYRYDNRDPSSFMMNPRLRDNDDYFGSNTNSLDDNNSSLGINFTVLTNDGMSNKRISSPKTSCNRGQSKSNSSSSNNSSNSMERLQRNGSDRTNGTTIKTSSSYDNMRMTVDNANSDIDGLRINSSSNGSSKQDNTFSDYPAITRVEQRRKYKTEFDKDYAEYRQLHTIMEKARKRFANLQDELRKVHPSDEQKYREIQNQIIQEYKENNNNSSFQDKKKRFEYLHEKLSHIKKLVSDFDMELTNANGNVAGGDNGMSYSSQNGSAKTMHTAY